VCDHTCRLQPAGRNRGGGAAKVDQLAAR
jgi:hypothetical protein